MILLMRILKGLPIRSASDKLLGDKYLKLIKIQIYNRYQSGLISMFYEFFNKKSATYKETVINIYAVCINQRLPKTLHKQIVRKF